MIYEAVVGHVGFGGDLSAVFDSTGNGDTPNIGERKPMRDFMQAAILSGALAVSGSVAAAENREHGAHVHGTARLDVAFVDGELALDLYSPAMNIVGFEHAPGNEAQRGKLADALSTLREAGRVFSVTDAAGCVSVHSEATRVSGEEHGEHEEHEDDHAGSDTGHSEIQARYRYECSAPRELERIHVRLFEHFPATETIRVQLLTETLQRAVVLTADRPDVPL